MQKFTRPITREIELAGERVALTLDEKGVSLRPVGSRKPPRELSWAALVCRAVAGGEEPGPEALAAAVQSLRGGPAAKPKPAPAEGKKPEGAPAPAPAPTPAPEGVAGVLARLQRWLEQHRPRYARGLLPGATGQELDALQAEVGVPLPDDLRALLHWHNGQGDDFVGSFEEDWNLMGTWQIAEARRGLVGAGAPPGERRGWVPFLDNDKGDYLFVDAGRPGAPVRAFWLGKPEQPEVAPSLAAWLGQFVNRVENGEYHEDPERGNFARRRA
ncbi:MAG TPA: SMI1/KNR4 family protein [Gemmataceae bacterium]|nr:SMI1/KNR4 family protein [Gemmataceae bacterium]